MLHTDTFEKNDPMFKQVKLTIFNDYFGDNDIELDHYYCDTEIYTINGVHRATVHYFNNEITHIVLERDYTKILGAIF